MAERYCIGPDGDHRWTWALAEHDGFAAITSADFPDLNLPGGSGRNLRGFRKTADGVEVRILTSGYSVTWPGDGAGYFRGCWVSTSRGDIRQVQRELGRLLGLRSFRVEKTRVFAWLTADDGSRRGVSRRDFMRSYATLTDQHDLRQVTTRQYVGQVIIGYVSPSDAQSYRGFD